jgi:hypothetical protein
VDQIVVVGRNQPSGPFVAHVFHGVLSELVRTRNGTKKAAAHIRNSGLRPEILFGSFFYSRASAENPVLNQATVDISYPVARPPLSRQPFLMLAVNETEHEIAS